MHIVLKWLLRLLYIHIFGPLECQGPHISFWWSLSPCVFQNAPASLELVSSLRQLIVLDRWALEDERSRECLAGTQGWDWERVKPCPAGAAGPDPRKKYDPLCWINNPGWTGPYLHQRNRLGRKEKKSHEEEGKNSIRLLLLLCVCVQKNYPRHC